MKKIVMKFQKPVLLALVAMLILTLSPIAVSAKTTGSESSEFYAKSITVTEDGGSYDIGFATVKFKRDCLDGSYPATFVVLIYAEGGKAYIQFIPDVAQFNKDVTIHIHNWSGYMLDVSTGQMVYINVPNQVFKVSHFSRYCFVF